MSPVEAVSWFGAVQSQLFGAAGWGIGQRCAGVDESALRAAFDAGRILRTHVLRPTWHFVAPADLRWMLALTAPRVHAASALTYRNSELDDVLLHRCAELITAALEGDQQLTRTELAAVLARQGINAGGVRLAYIVMWCELEGVICSGRMRGRQHTYALVNERIAPTVARERDWALAELARRYFDSHGPAQVRDFAWWSGLRPADARSAVEFIRADLDEQIHDGRSYWCGTGSVPAGGTAPQVHPLPNFDEFVVAYQDRSALFGSPESEGEHAGIAALSNNLLVSRGHAAGTWKSTVKAGRVRVAATLSTACDTDALAEAAAGYGRFLGLPFDLDVQLR